MNSIFHHSNLITEEVFESIRHDTIIVKVPQTKHEQWFNQMQQLSGDIEQRKVTMLEIIREWAEKFYSDHILTNFVEVLNRDIPTLKAKGIDVKWGLYLQLTPKGQLPPEFFGTLLLT